jgi:hypothetical protein
VTGILSIAHGRPFCGVISTRLPTLLTRATRDAHARYKFAPASSRVASTMPLQSSCSCLEHKAAERKTLEQCQREETRADIDASALCISLTHCTIIVYYHLIVFRDMYLAKIRFATGYCINCESAVSPPRNFCWTIR